MSPSRGPKKAFWLAFTCLLCCARAAVWNLTAAVLPRRNQDVQFYCGANCENLLELKLASDCASVGDAALLRLGQEAGVRWARLDASSLTAGMHYSVCLFRVDTAAFEDTGDTVFISPIQEVHPLMVQPSSSQELSITCVPGCTSSTEVFLALDCADLTGAPSAALTGFRAFWSVTVDLSSLSFGQVYKVCADIDGAGVSVLLAGDTGLSVRTAGPTSVQVVSIMGAPSQRLPLFCNGCSHSTALYLLDTGSACSSDNTGSHLGTAPTSTSSVLLTGAGSQWDAIIDATSMTTGTDYKICVDLDGSSRELAFVDTGLTVQITSITGVVSATFHVGGVTDLELTTDLSDGSLANAYAYVGAECSTAFSSSAGERNTVEQTVLGVVNGVISFPLVVTGLSQGKFYRACIDEDGPNAQGFVDVGVPIYVTGVTVVTPSGVARATNQQLEVTCDPCSTSTMLYLTSTSCNTLITNGDPGVPSGEDIQRQTIATAVAAGTAANLWTWTVDATNLAPGRQFHLCADVDGTGTYPFGDTALQIYTSPFSEVVTKGINVAELQTVYVRCSTGCSETGRAYLALRSITPSNLFVKECDSSVTDGVMVSYGNENTGSVSLVHKSGDLWAIENIDATSLIAGRYYGICVDMDGAVSTLGFGDTGFMIYVSGLEGISPSAIRQAFAQEIQLTCPYCNPNNDITQAYISLECDTTLYFGFNLPATTGVNSPTNRLPGPGGSTTPDATKLYIDARELDLGGVYHLCMDLDGSNAKMGMGDTSFLVYVTTMTAINPWGILPAQNQTVVMTCPSGCSDASAAYVGSYCDETVKNGEMTAVTGERTTHGSFTKPSTLPTDDYEVMLDAEGMTPGKHYSFCTDLDGSNTYLPWGNADLPIYISPVNKTWYNGFYSSATAELRLNCESCSIDSRVYIIDEQYFCDHLDFGGQKTGSADQSSSVATTPLGGTAGVVLAFVDSTALTPGLRFRICVDLDGVATDYAFGDTGFQVYMASVTASGGTISAAAGQVLTMTCSGCSTDTMAYLAVTCDGTITDGNIVANGAMNTAAVNLAGASPDWTATIDASSLQAGRHYTLCTDLDGSTGTNPMGANDFLWYVTGSSGIPHYKFGLKQQKGVTRKSSETLIFDCPQCSNSSSAYLAIACDSTDFGGVRSTPTSRYSGTASAFLEEFDTGWGATFDTSQLTVGVNYQLCLDMDGVREDLAFGFAGQTIYISAMVSTANVAVSKTFNAYLELTCESADSCPSTALLYLALWSSECATATSAFVFDAGNTQNAAALILGDTSTTTRYQEVSATGLASGGSYQICVDLDGSSTSTVGGTTFAKTFGWTGLSVYLSTVTAVEPAKINNQAAQILTLTCIDGNAGCPQSATTIYLTSEGRCEDLIYDGSQLVANSSRTPSSIVYQPVASEQAVQIDASTLHVGDLYELCVDYDGVTTTLGFGNSAVKIYVSGPMYIATDRLLPRTVEPSSGQYVSLDCSSGCSENSTAYLALTCDMSSNTVKSATSGVNTASEPLLEEFPSRWRININAVGLAPGYYYSICVDMDGEEANQYSGDSGVSVYINPLTPAMAMALPAASSQVLIFSCASCSSSGSPGAYLATSCSISQGFPGFTKTSGVDPEVDANGAVNTESAFLQQSGSYWTITLDTSLLTQGSYYVLCADMDGGPTSGQPDSNPLKIGETVEVYITSIQSLQTDVILAALNQHISFTCQSCDATTEMYLADACDTSAYGSVVAITGSRTASVAIESGVFPAWEVVLDASTLAGGRDYRLCVDQDGNKTVQRGGDAQLSVTVSGLLFVSESSVLPGPSQVLSLQCSALGGCTSGTSKLYLAKSCDTTISTGIVSASGEDYSSSFVMTGSGTNFFATVNTSRLQPGRHYKVCADIDGVGDLRMVDSLQEVYISPVFAGHPKLEGPWPSVLRASGQALSFNCPSCSNVSEGWLGEDCGNATDPNILRTPSFSLQGEGSSWVLPIDATPLTSGESYYLCLDLDGDGVDLRPGNALSTLIYVSAVNSVQPAFVDGASGQTVHVGCLEGCTNTVVSLAETCSAPLATATLTAGEAILDASSLRLGLHYRLCTDFDGNGNQSFGDTGFLVYVTGVVEKAPRSTVGPGLSLLRLLCESCSELSTAYITTASSCDYWVVNGVMEEAADRTAAAAFLQESTHYWEVPIRTSAGVHEFGLFYRICADLDGVMTDLGFGDSGLFVFASPISALQVAYRVLEASSGLVAATGQRLVVTCAACNVTSEVHLAESCESTPFFPSVNVTLPVALVQLPGYLDNEWVADLDATNLQPGASFELCIDIDGSTSPGPVGGSNFEVYVSPVTALDSHTLQQLPNEKLTVACDECTVDTALYLGATCTQSSIIASMSATTTEGLWEATFDASGLTIGSNYKLCSDLDGSGLFRPLGNTGLSIYVSPVAGVGGLTTLTASVADASVALRITCSSSCGNDAEAFLGQECFDVGDLDPDAAPPSARFSTWASLVEVPGFLTERSVVIPIDNLEAGRYYRLCIDADGAAHPLLPGDTGVTVYMTPVVSGPVSLLLHGSAAEVEIQECLLCSNESQAHLAESCDPPVGTGRQSHPSAVNLQLRANRWWLQVSSAESASLMAFTTYRLCLDLDGELGPLKLGDTGSEVFVSGIAPGRATASTDEHGFYSLEVQCFAGCAAELANATKVRISYQCDASEPDAGARGAERWHSTASAVLLPAFTGWFASLDISMLRPGQVYRLCVDGDGPGPLREGDAGWEIYASPIQLLTTAVPGGSGRRALQMICAGCSEQTQVRLALDCNEESSTVPSSIARISSTGWSASISMLGLLAGQTYRLCSDLDGGSELPWGDTAFTVHISPITSLRNYAMRPSTAASIEMSCVEAAGCSTSSLGLLADESCSLNLTAPNGTSPAVFAQVSATAWNVELDTTGLALGMNYALCVDLDGNGPLPLGPTGMEVFITSVVTAEPATIRAAAGQVLTLTCDVVCYSMWVHLAEFCTGNGLIPAEVPGEPSKTFMFEAGVSGQAAAVSIDTSALRPGRSYAVCVDHGFGAGDSGLRVYVAGAADVKPRQIQAMPAQQLNFHCDVCSRRPDNRPVRLAGGTPYSGRLELLHASRWGTVCNRNFTNLEAAVVCHQLGLRGGTVLPATQTIAGSGPIWLSAVACDGSEWGLGQCEATWESSDCTHAEDVGISCSSQQLDPSMCCSKDSQVFLQAGGTLCTDASPYILGTSTRSASASLYGVASTWSAAIDASSLIPGAYYSICIDTDGAIGALDPGAIDSIYVSPLLMFGTVAIRKAVAQTIQLNCSACNSDTSIFLATYCSMPDTPAALLTQMSAEVDASMLEIGHAYTVCIDLGANYTAGSSGFVAYVSGVTSADPFVYPTSQHSFTLTCDGCSDTTQIFLGTEECQVLWSPRAILATAGVLDWTSYLDATALQVGMYYQLCVDLDGENQTLQGGPTGLDVFVSAVLDYEHPIDGVFRANLAQKIRLMCSSCSRAAEAFLGESCRMFGENTTASAPATLSPRAVFQFDGVIWSVEIDASDLHPGGRYRLCIDMDGQATGLTAGDTGLTVYLSPAKELDPLTILPLPQQTVGPFACEVCSEVTRAYLGVECPGHITGLVGAYNPGDTDPQDLNQTNDTALPGKWFKSSGDGGLLANPDGVGWVVTLNAENLTAGYHYRLCLDLDGFDAALGFGDTGVKVSVVAELPVAPEPAPEINLSSVNSSNSSILDADAGR